MRIRPPRALWVPFDLGRPLGAPDDPDFQRAVLLEALQLLVAEGGPPLLADYALDAPATVTVADGWACPLDLPAAEAEAGELGQLAAAFGREMEQMRSWYDLAVTRRGATTVGTSGVAIDALADFLCALLNGRIPAAPDGEIPMSRLVNLVADDVRALYAEALTARPGQGRVRGEQLADWFYTETAAGRALYALRRSADLPGQDGELAAIAGALAFPARLAARG